MNGKHKTHKQKRSKKKKHLYAGLVFKEISTAIYSTKSPATTLHYQNIILIASNFAILHTTK